MINTRNILILLVLCYVFFMFGNSILSLTNPDEVFYTQTAREMVQHKTWMTPYLFGHPQFEKPIFLYWLLRIGFIFFGVTSFAARFFPALFGGLGVIATYMLCLAGFGDRKKAFLCSLILMSGGLYIGLARTVFTDMIFSVFILLSLLSFFWAYTRKEHSPQGTILFFVFSGCAVLSKGPLGFIIPFLVVFIFLGIRREWGFKLTRYSLWGLILFLLISLPWYMLMISKYGTVFTSEFFVNDHLRRLIEAEHLAADTWYFYPGSMLMGMFPWSFYLLAAAVLFFKDLKGRKDPIYPFLASWIIVVFLVFQPAHSKLASYIFPMFPALAVLTGDFIYDAAISGRHRRALSVASWATLAFIVFFVFSLAVGVFAFSQYMLKYLSSGIPIYILIVLFILLALFFFEALRRREFIKSAYLLMLFIPMIFSVFPLIVRDIEPYLSLKNSCDYLLKNAKSDGAVLCSKFYVRGVRFYTDKEVAVMNPHGKNFFSPHPVTYLDTDDKVRAFLRSQPVTYGVLKRSSLEDLQRQEPEFKTELLKEIGSEYVVMIAPVKGKKR